MLNGFRLSGSPNPVPLADDITEYPSGYVTELSLVPFVHGMITLWNGRHWQIVRSNTRIALTLPNSGLSMGQLPWDVFASLTDQSTIQIELSNQWTDSVTRSEPIARTADFGVWVKASDPRKLYVGTVRGNNSSTVVDVPSQRFVYSFYNQVDRYIYTDPSSLSSWNTAGNTNVRSRNNQTDSTSKCEVMLGMSALVQAEIAFDLTSPLGSGVAAVPIFAIDSTTTVSTGSYSVDVSPDAYTAGVAMSTYFRATWAEQVPMGAHAINWNERQTSSAIVQIHGSRGFSPGVGLTSHFRGKVRM